MTLAAGQRKEPASRQRIVLEEMAEVSDILKKVYDHDGQRP